MLFLILCNTRQLLSATHRYKMDADDSPCGIIFFLKDNETSDACAEQLVEVNFDFFDSDSMVLERRTFCSFKLCYRKDDPSQWAMTLVKNSNLDPSDQKVYALTSCQPFSFLSRDINVSSGSYEDLCRPINEEWVKGYIKELVSEKETILPEKALVPECYEDKLFSMLRSDGIRLTASMRFACRDTKCYLYQAMAFLCTHNLGANNTGLYHEILAIYEPYLSKLGSDSYLKADIERVLKTAYIDEQITGDKNYAYLGYALKKIVERNIEGLAMPAGLPQFLPLKASMINRIRDLQLVDSEKIIDALLSVRLKLSHDLLPEKPTATDFYPLMQGLLKIESASAAIMERLATEAPEKHQNAVTAEREYLCAMYALMYEQAVNPSNKTDFLDKIQEIEAPFLKELDVDRNPWLRIALQILVNALTLVFTFGYANIQHQAATGDFFFFSRPESAEALRALDTETVAIICPC